MGHYSHIIHRVNLEIEVPNERMGGQVRDDALLLLKNEILPELERWLDTMINVDEHIIVDQLTLAIGPINSSQFEIDFGSVVLSNVQEKIERVINGIQSTAQNPGDGEDEIALKYTPQQMLLESFLFFLKHGRLPWSCNEMISGQISQETLIEAALHSSPAFLKRLIRLILENKKASERLLLQYSEKFTLRIVSYFSKSKGSLLEANDLDILFNHSLKKLTDVERISYSTLPLFQLFISIVLNKLTIMDNIGIRDMELMLDETIKSKSKKYSNESLPLNKKEFLKEEEIITSTFSKPGITISERNASTGKRKKQASEEDGIYVKHAGLILLHPFLEYYFMEFNLLLDKKFRDAEASTKAIHLLHYLSTGVECAPEFELTFEKYICNWSLDEPIERNVILSKEMKAEGDKLLNAVIKHWSALKSTSLDGLREGFLQREGKLILGDFQNRLVVENKAQDVLLSFMPWGYSIVKLPWMDHALYVEWQV